MSESKTKILTAASELFGERGASALSVRAISNRAGLSTMGIYNHFNGKQGILDALYIEGFQHVMDAIDVIDGQRSPRDAVLMGLSNYIEFAQEKTEFYNLIFGRSDPTYTPSSEAIVIGEEAFNKLTHLVSRAIPVELSGREKRQTTLELWALAHGYVSLREHEATDLVPNTAWRDLMMSAVTLHLDAIIAKYTN